MSTKGDRDATMEALLRTSLRCGPPGATDDCPPADVLAAYVEGLLGAHERGTAELHFAACERCQDALAALSDMADLHPVAQPSRAWPRLRWLVPAAGVLTLLIVYVAIRPQIGRFQPGSQQVPARGLAEQPATEVRPQAFGGGAPAASVTARNETRGAAPARAEAKPKQEARLEVEQTPAAAAAAKLVAQNVPRADTAVAPARPKPAEIDTKAVPAGLPSQVALDALEMKAAAPPAAAPQLAVSGVQPSAAAPSQLAAGAVSGNVAGVKPQAMAKGAADAAPPAAEAREARVGPIGESVAVLGGGPFTMTSRDGRATWRFDTQLVSRSTDNGISWRSAQTGATATLLSASSPTAAVAWAVGMKGTIVRTADGGEHWTRCSFPKAVDLVSVDAKDDRTATVVTRDGRRFATSDAGATWTQAR